jgi:hypothetical protein
MKKRRLFLILTTMLIMHCSLCACSPKNDFYQKGSGWDYLRFPLLEPYYAIYNVAEDENGWVIPLHLEPSKKNFLHYLDIQDVRKIAVENGTIMVYTPYSKLIQISEGQDKELHWFIIRPDQGELGFETEEEFIFSLKQYDIDQPMWYEPLSILQKFDQTRCLEWIPNCGKNKN